MLWRRPPEVIHLAQLKLCSLWLTPPHNIRLLKNGLRQNLCPQLAQSLGQGEDAIAKGLRLTLKEKEVGLWALSETEETC